MPFVLTRNRIIILGIAALILVFFILVFLGLIPGLRLGTQRAPQLTLTVWGVFDTNRAWDTIAIEYRKLRPNVEIRYKEMNPETYEADLLDALAAGNGPDVFMFHNTWLPKHINKITPLAESQFPFVTFRDSFPQVIVQDFAPEGIIYASPLYLDTLAMFYNKDVFDRKKVVQPPKTWTEFQNAVTKLRELNPSTNEIIRAGAAIGGSNRSINRATDLLNLLMLQSGTEMVNENFTDARFAQSSDNKNPGLSSLEFYTQFANPSSPFYTWHQNLHYSVDNFIEGATAIIFNYSHQIAAFRAKNPFLNFGVAPAPQITGSTQPVSYANYWGLAVSNKSKNPSWAWDLILYATTDETAAKTYLNLTRKPPALRSLIQANINDPDLGVFAQQALIARSWPQIDNNKIEEIFSDMIEAVINGQLTHRNALQKAESEVSQLMRLRQ